MANSSWIETKRDADLDESGNTVVRKVQLEPAGFTGKNKIDLVLRLIGLMAILTPIMLVYLQQKASLDTQKAMKQLDVYSATATELSSIFRRPVSSPAFAASKEELTFNLPPKIAFLFNAETSNNMEEIVNIIPIYEAVSHNSYIIDSLFTYANESASILTSFESPADFTKEDAEVSAHNIRVMDSCVMELSNWLTIIENYRSEATDLDTGFVKLLDTLIANNRRLLPVYSGIDGSSSRIFEILSNRSKPLPDSYQEEVTSLASMHSKLLATGQNDPKKYRSIQKIFKSKLLEKTTYLQRSMRRTNGAFQD